MSIKSDKKWEIIEFLKEHSIFKFVEAKILAELSPLLSEVEYGPGQIVFHEGDEADALYLIKSGAVAVMQNKDRGKATAYLTAGECFGEMAIIQETTRNATIRVPEEAVLLRLPKQALNDLTKRSPDITVAIADLINKRSTGNISFIAPGLQGNLAFFDLPTVVQTLLSSRNQGLLSLYRHPGKLAGQITVNANTIVQAYYGELTGSAAIFELLCLTEPLDFIFEHNKSKDKLPATELSERSPQMLLMEGARRSDELTKLIRVTSYPHAVYKQLNAIPSFDALENEHREICRQIWSLIEVGENIGEICRQLPYDRYSILNVIEAMLKRSMIGLCQNETNNKIAKSDIQPEFGKTVSAETAENPFELVRIVNAVNGVCINLGLIYGKEKIRSIVQTCLIEACRTYPSLASAKIQTDSPALDLRHASDDFSNSKSSTQALLHLSNLVLAETSSMQKQEN
ncbi:MAG: cyclic nucleotide-binding domain-containing protein [Candidatus Obscuribacterales bacterium]|nr:cyclic nucleotide-binding domain-containing protein [Candidatus Obscuribacterales bacterium]